MKLSREELAYGASISLAFFWVLGLWVFLVAPITSALWALGGAEGGWSGYRRLGVPCVLAGSLAIVTRNHWCLASILPAFGLTSCGYGLPTIAPGRPDNDEGSVLGLFFWKLTGGKEWLTNLLTRGLIMSGLFLSFVIPLWIS